MTHAAPSPRSGRAPLVGALLVALLAGCGPKGQTQISSMSGKPMVRGTLKSADGAWTMTIVERDPTDPDLHGMAWQVWLGPTGQPFDSTHAIFDAQRIQPTPEWRTADSITIRVTGSASDLADIPPSYHSTESVLGRDGQRHTFAVFVTQEK